METKDFADIFSSAYVADHHGDGNSEWKLYRRASWNSITNYHTEWSRGNERFRMPVSRDIESTATWYTRNDLADIDYQHVATKLNDNTFIVEKFGNGTPEFAASHYVFLVSRKLPHR